MENVLPPNLRYLKFGFDYFQRILENSLPAIITELIFSDLYNYPINHPLPKSLKTLGFGYDFTIRKQV